MHLLNTESANGRKKEIKLNEALLKFIKYPKSRQLQKEINSAPLEFVFPCQMLTASVQTLFDQWLFWDFRFRDCTRKREEIYAKIKSA